MSACHPLKTLPRLFVGALIALTMLAGSARADEAPTVSPKLTLADYYQAALPAAITQNAIANFFLGGTPKLELRLAYEHADLADNAPDAASELNLRTRLDYRSGTLYHSSFFLQLQNTWDIVHDYNYPTGDGETGRDIIGDRPGTRFQQAYFDLGVIPDTVIRGGVQEINLDDQRLIGSVGWRQNAQSFGGVRVMNHSIKGLSLDGSYLTEVFDINLRSEPDIDSLVLLHAEYAFDPAFKVALFDYLFDASVAAKDSATRGFRAYGTTKYLLYDVTYARQSDYQEGHHDGKMYTGYVASVSLPVNVGAGYQHISGGGGAHNFDTLFSTAHKFQGWADNFLATNGGGLSGGMEDIYFDAKTAIAGTNLYLCYHRFNTTDTLPNGFDGTYGSEIDVSAGRKLCRSTVASIGWDYYLEGDDKARNPTHDKSVIWARLEYTF